MKIYGRQFLTEPEPEEPWNINNWNWKPAHKDWLENAAQFWQSNHFISHKVSKNTKKIILALGRWNIQMGALLSELKNQDLSFIGIDWDDFISEGAAHFELGKKSFFKLFFHNFEIDLARVSAVYYSEPLMTEAFLRNTSSFSTSELLYLARWNDLLKNLYACTPKANWFPSIPNNATEHRQQKLSELILAQKLGLNIPDTITTTSPKQASNFLKRNNNSVLFREFSLRTINDNTKLKTFKVSFAENNSPDWKFITETPCTFQKFIKKKFDIRVIIIGKKVLACKIDSQKSQKSKVDWRIYDFQNVSFTPIRLPASISKKLIKFVQLNGFNFASIDLIYSSSGKYYFLEMNRPGQWLFIQALSGLQIKEELVKALKRTQNAN